MTHPNSIANGAMMDTLTKERRASLEWAIDAAVTKGYTADADVLRGLLSELLSASKPAVQDEREQAYREATKPRPETSGVGEYCQPGDRREPRWIVMYDDADRGLSIFEDEQDARDCFANSEAMGWNCWLFSPTPRRAAVAQDERAAEISEAQVIDAIKKACGEYRTNDSYSFEDVWNCIEAFARAASPQAAQSPKGDGGWLRDSSLVYRLTDELRPQNRDEINVTMADGSRREAARVQRAEQLVTILNSAAAPQAGAGLTDAQREALKWAIHVAAGDILHADHWKALFDLRRSLSHPAGKAEDAQATATMTDDARDAARYRWLRLQQWNDADMFVITGTKSQVYLGTYCPSLALLDDAIDTAIAASAEKGEKA